MSKNIKDIPFTEIVEVVQDLSRSSSDDKSRIRGIINRNYTKHIPREMDWYFLKSGSSIITVAEVKSGVVTVNTQDTVCTFSGGETMTAALTGRKIKFTGNNNIYDFTFTDTTGGTISPPLSLATNLSMGAYTIFQPIYSLNSEFDRFPVNGGVLYYSGGQPTPLPEKEDDDYYAEFSASPSSTPEFCRLVGTDTQGVRQVEIQPPPSQSMVMPYEYLKLLDPMRETTGGTVIVSGSDVAGTATRFTEATTGDFFRQDLMGKGNDSEWYRITTITHDSAIILSAAVVSDNAVGQEYTISSAPKYPVALQEALIYGAMRNLLPDQNDPNFLYYHSEYAQVLSDNKILIQTRKSKDNVELIAEDYDYRR